MPAVESLNNTMTVFKHRAVSPFYALNKSLAKPQCHNTNNRFL